MENRFQLLALRFKHFTLYVVNLLLGRIPSDLLKYDLIRLALSTLALYRLLSEHLNVESGRQSCQQILPRS